MAEVTINYKDAAIATMDASGTKTLQTQGKYCEDDIEVVYSRPSGGSFTITSVAVRIQNEREAGGAMTCVRISFNAYNSNMLGCSSDGNIAYNATSADKNFAFFNNSYIVMHTSFVVNSISYNDVPVQYDIYGTGGQRDVIIYLPNGFDNSYPLVFT